MSRYSYREPAWMILLGGACIGMLAGFPAGWLAKSTVRPEPQGVYVVGGPNDPNTWEGGVVPQQPKRSTKNTLWEIGMKAAEESKREREAAGR